MYRRARIAVTIEVKRQWLYICHVHFLLSGMFLGLHLVLLIEHSTLFLPVWYGLHPWPDADVCLVHFAFISYVSQDLI